MRQQMSETEANQMSIRVELQADCFAGMWGHYTKQKGILEQGDLEEALNAAQQIGDDTLQKKMQGYVVPESFNHGTSQQRMTWFKRGFDTGKIGDCDTFNNPVCERIRNPIVLRTTQNLNSCAEIICIPSTYLRPVSGMNARVGPLVWRIARLRIAARSLTQA